MRNVFACMIISFIIFFIGVAVGVDIVKNKQVTVKVENNKKIDSLKEDNKTIIIEVEHLDSVKNEKIVKVKELDNDSTLKLFYELLEQ